MNIIDAIKCCNDTSLDFLREVSCFMTQEHGVLSLTTNHYGGSVDFGWDKIWSKLKDEYGKYNSVYMVHSHPDGVSQMSSIDVNMVQGWRKALGVPVYFNIVTLIDDVLFNKGMNVISFYKVDKNVDNKIEISFNGTRKMDDVYFHKKIYRTVYGLSKCPDLTDENVMEIENELRGNQL